MRRGSPTNYGSNVPGPSDQNNTPGGFGVWSPTTAANDGNSGVSLRHNELTIDSWPASNRVQAQQSGFSNASTRNVSQNQSFGHYLHQSENEQYLPTTTYQPQQQVRSSFNNYAINSQGNIYDNKHPYGLAGVEPSENISDYSTRLPPSGANRIPSNLDDMPRHNPTDYTQSQHNSALQYNQREQNFPPPHIQQTDWQDFRNPLSLESEDNTDSDVMLVTRMKKAADEAASKNTMRKPTGFSTAALVCLQKDLKDAAEPFQSPEALKQYRNLNLGIATDSRDPMSQASKSDVASVLDDLSLSNLSINAPDFVPRKNLAQVKLAGDVSVKEQEQESERATISLNLIDDCINQLICNPACFDVLVPTVIQQLRSYNLSKSAVSILVDKVYEMCVVEQNFRFLGSRFCDQLSRSSTGLPKFRYILLNKAQREFSIMDDALRGRPDSVSRVLGFTQFIAELFLHLMCEKENGDLQRFTVLGRGMLKILRKLVDNPNDDNLQCAVRVLKLTIIPLEESLNNDGKNSLKSLESILNDLESFARRKGCQSIVFNSLTNQLLDGFVRLRKMNWGKTSGDETQVKTNSPVLPETDENYYMNEPIFFTPNGVQYTAADAADPDFFNQHLAPHTMQQQQQQQQQQTQKNNQPEEDYYTQANAFLNEEYLQNPLTSTSNYSRMPYTNWSTGEPDNYDPTCAEDIGYQDDYDAEFEAFLRSSGQ